VQTVSWHTLGGSFAMQHGWSIHLSGQTRGRVAAPRAIQSATCTPAGQSEERMIIAWDEHMGWTKGRYDGPIFVADASGGFYQQSSRGRVTELNIKADGSTTLVSDTALDLCMEMGEVTASSDCSVIGVLCRSKSPPAEVTGAIDLITQNPTGFGWTNEWCHREQVGDDKESGGKGGGQCPSYDTRDDSLYLLEYTTASTSGGASATVCVNKAIGGWPIGNWAVSLDKSASTYLLDLKVTAGGHEGSVNLAVDRNGWQYNAALSAGWACGVGHTEANQLTYNSDLGTWARLCWTDGNSDGTANMWASYFQTLPASGGSGTKQILKLPGGNQPNANPNPLYEGPGGAAFFISLGSAGWAGVGYRPVPADAAKPSLEQQLALSLIDLKPTSDECRPAGGAEHDGSACGFIDLVDLPGHSLWNYDGIHGALGFVNLARLGTGTDLLVGYATRIKHLNEDYPPLEYRVAKVSRSGSILATKKLEGTGWGEEDAWLALANGCVAFPFVWHEYPGAVYGNNGADGSAGTARFSNKLRVTVVCDQ